MGTNPIFLTLLFCYGLHAACVEDANKDAEHEWYPGHILSFSGDTLTIKRFSDGGFPAETLKGSLWGIELDSSPEKIDSARKAIAGFSESDTIFYRAMCKSANGVAAYSIRTASDKSLNWKLLENRFAKGNSDLGGGNIVPAQPESLENIWGRSGGVALYFENDVVLDWLSFLPVTNSDENYTMGLSVEVLGNKMRYLNPVYGGRLLAESWHWTSPDTVYRPYQFSTMVGCTSFTPHQLRDSNVIEGDRPYASLFFLTDKEVRKSRDGRRTKVTAFTVGILGTSVSEYVQTTLHGWLRGDKEDCYLCSPPKPRGWDHQISNGGELTAEYETNWITTLFAAGLPGAFDGITGEEKRGYGVGYNTNANLGYTLKLGRMPKESFDFMNGLGSTSRAPTEKGKVNTDWSYYLFGDANGYFVLYNALLNGQFAHSDYSLSFQQTRHFVYDYKTGFTVEKPWNHVKLSLVCLLVSGHSPEFDGHYSRYHNWASTFLEIRWR